MTDTRGKEPLNLGSMTLSQFVLGAGVSVVLAGIVFWLMLMNWDDGFSWYQALTQLPLTILLILALAALPIALLGLPLAYVTRNIHSQSLHVLIFAAAGFVAGLALALVFMGSGLASEDPGHWWSMLLYGIMPFGLLGAVAAGLGRLSLCPLIRRNRKRHITPAAEASTQARQALESGEMQ